MAEYDVLHDEGIALGEHLMRSGVAVDIVQASGLAHGFVRLFNLLPEADQAIDAAVARIRNACAT